MRISKAHGEAISIAVTALVCSYIDQKNGGDIHRVWADRDEAIKRLIELGVPHDKGYSEFSKRGQNLSFEVWKKVIESSEE